MLCDKCKPVELKAMRTLESLTPGGSEFVNDPEFCRDYIRRRWDNELDHIKRLVPENRELRAKVAELEKEVERLRNQEKPVHYGSFSPKEEF